MLGYHGLAIFLLFVSVKHSIQQSFASLGCWKDGTGSLERAIPNISSNVSGNINTLNATEAVLTCAHLAKHDGYDVFGVRDNAKCVGSTHAGLTYLKYGPSHLCHNGTGGAESMNIYSFAGSHTHDEDKEESEASENKRNFIHQPPGFTYDGFQIRLTSESTAVENAERRQFPPPSVAEDPLFVKGGLEPVEIEPIFTEIDELNYGDVRHIPRGVNILQNPSFELPLTRNPMTGWSCQGETDDPRGGVISQYPHDHHGDGTFSGICFARLSEWAGPGQYIGRKVKSGRVYQFLGWTKVIDNGKTNDIHSLELWLRLKKRGDKTKHTMKLAQRNKLLEDSGWVRWKTAFQMPWSSRGFQYVFLFFKGPKASVDILVDDMYLTEVYQDKKWKEKTDKLIEHYRKRDVSIRINVPPQRFSQSDLSHIDIKVQQKKHKFAFGAAVNSLSLLNNHKYREFFFKHFEWAVLENSMKWPSTEAKEGHIDYKEADSVIEILEKNNISVRGHCIFWAVSGQVPLWLKKLSKGKALDCMKRRLDSLVGRYRGRLYHWDVNNEMLHGSYFADRMGGKSIREWMFKKTAELDPEADLFLNDFDVVENGQLTEVFVEEAKELINRGITVDGIGVQGHFTGSVNPTLLRVRLNALSEAKRPIWLTEVDVFNPNPVKRAESLENVMRVSFSHPNVEGIILWAFWDINSWRGRNAALVDGNEWKLNAAGRRYENLLNKWTTREYLKPTSVDYSGADADFRAFHGDYEILFTLPDGQIVKREFTLDPGKDAFRMDIDIDGRPSSNILPIWPGDDFNDSDYLYYKKPEQDSDKSTVPSQSQENVLRTADNYYSNENQQNNEKPREQVINKDASGSRKDKIPSTVQYVGCFDNSNTYNTLIHKYRGTAHITPEICVSYCRTHEFQYAGVQSSSDCYCGWNIDRRGRRDRNDCNMTCQGDYQEHCGGRGVASVYDTKKINLDLNEQFQDSRRTPG